MNKNYIFLATNDQTKTNKDKQDKAMIGSPEKKYDKTKLEEQVSNAIFYFLYNMIKNYTHWRISMSDTSRSAWILAQHKANTVRHNRTQLEGDQGLLICLAPLRQVLNVFFVSNGGEIYLIE